MDKIVYRFASDEPYDQCEKKIWYVSDDIITNDFEDEKNPWYGTDWITRKKIYLMDDCLVTLRPARSEDRIGRSQDINRNEYFLEISNQDRTIILTSYGIYDWDDAIEKISLFKNLSFDTAKKVWTSKKY